MIARVLLIVLLLLLAIPLLPGSGQPAADGMDLSLNSERRGVALMDESEIRLLYDAPLNLPRPVRIDPDRSLFVRHPERLAGIDFATMMALLADGTGETPNALFTKWWRTMAVGISPDDNKPCDVDVSDVPALPLNPFDIACDRALAGLADLADPLGADDPGFKIIAAINRGDLSQPGYDCGEYRLVVALPPDVVGIREFYLNFEATVLNPHPADESFCQAIQLFWANLYYAPDSAAIADQLRRFFLEPGRLTSGGDLLPATSSDGFAWTPVISRLALGGDSPRPGRIAVNTLTSGELWMLREFKFRGDALLPVPVDNSPHPSTFASTSPQVGIVTDTLTQGIDGLAETNMLKFALTWPAALNANQQASKNARPPTSSTPYASAMGTEVRDTFASLATPAITADYLVKRVTLLSCAGCHEFSNRGPSMGFGDGRWPGSQQFTHICIETGTDGQYKVSRLLSQMLLPLRENSMRAMLGAPSNPAPTQVAVERCDVHRM